jgi:streptogramin lyase
MPSLLTNATEDTVGSLVSHTGPCTVWVTGQTAGATVVLQGSPTTNTADVVKLERGLIPQGVYVDRTGCCSVEVQGTYTLRAVVEGATAQTNVSVQTTQ